MTGPTRCPECDHELDTDYGHEAACYEVTCPECRTPLVVHRLVTIEFFATRKPRRKISELQSNDN